MKIRESGEKRALLISATGTGRTYASAFALREENPEKALFLVHREEIAKQAIESYKKVFGETKKFGLLSGNTKDYEADYLFSTMQMMEKPETLNRFHRHEFQTIIITRLIELALTGEDSQEKREEAIERLVADDVENQLDYILTVDIFNEGIRSGGKSHRICFQKTSQREKDL